MPSSVLQHAKNDRIDAALIAALHGGSRGKCMNRRIARLAPLAEHLTMIEQLSADIARFKTRREACREARIRGTGSRRSRGSRASWRRELKELIAAIRQYRDLAKRFDLIASVDGIGLRTAVTILVRMPEIGRVSREQAAALAGLAPYDDDSGREPGARHIKGGRQRLRQSLYAAALPAAFNWNPQLKAIYRRLIAAGKPHKVALVACARKLLIFVNTVVPAARPGPLRRQPHNGCSG